MEPAGAAGGLPAIRGGATLQITRTLQWPPRHDDAPQAAHVPKADHGEAPTSLTFAGDLTSESVCCCVHVRTLPASVLGRTNLRLLA
jgi:hypothetical protein